jgi:hypothetical protein
MYRQDTHVFAAQGLREGHLNTTTQKYDTHNKQTKKMMHVTLGEGGRLAGASITHAGRKTGTLQAQDGCALDYGRREHGPSFLPEFVFCCLLSEAQRRSALPESLGF